MRRLDIARFLDQAEWDFLVNGKTEFVFPVRRKSGESDFYERLDRELREQSIMQVRDLREVKEGFTRISRPASLSIDLETLLRERPHVSIWKGQIENLARAFDFLDLYEFLRQEGREAAHDLILLEHCLEVLAFLIKNRHEVSGLLPRQLPHGRSTKLIGIENLLLKLFGFWRGQVARWSDFYAWFELLDKPLEFRFYAPVCSCQGSSLRDFHGILARDWIAAYEFGALDGTLIVENFESMLALIPDAKSTLLIWGGGWRAVHLRWILDRLPTPIHYWGDIDREGYEIFGALKAHNPDLEPVLMAHDMIEKYRSLQQRKEIFLGPFKEVPGLQNEYEFVARRGIRIEQEQIREQWPLGTRLR